jgi:putative ABC transport system substrate-binding protein
VLKKLDYGDGLPRRTWQGEWEFTESTSRGSRGERRPRRSRLSRGLRGPSTCRLRRCCRRIDAKEKQTRDGTPRLDPLDGRLRVAQHLPDHADDGASEPGQPMMDRRPFIVGGLAALTAPLAAGAQQARKVWRIGLLVPGLPPGCGSDSRPPVLLALQEGLRELGYIERQNYVLVPRCAVREGEEMLSAARDLVGQNVDIVMVGSNELAEAFKMATKTVPGVFIAVADPDEAGLVASLARPGGNITGFSHLTGELTGKRLQLLKETLPRLRRVAALATQRQRQIEREAARQGLQIQIFIARQPGEIDAAFAAARAARPEALLIHPHPMFWLERRRRAARLGDRPPRDLRECGLRGGGWPYGVRREPGRHGAACRRVHRPDPQGRQACRFACRAAHEIRACDQHENGEGPRPHDPAVAAGAGGSGYRIELALRSSPADALDTWPSARPTTPA